MGRPVLVELLHGDPCPVGDLHPLVHSKLWGVYFDVPGDFRGLPIGKPTRQWDGRNVELSIVLHHRSEMPSRTPRPLGSRAIRITLFDVPLASQLREFL